MCERSPAAGPVRFGRGLEGAELPLFFSDERGERSYLAAGVRLRRHPGARAAHSGPERLHRAQRSHAGGRLPEDNRVPERIRHENPERWQVLRLGEYLLLHCRLLRIPGIRGPKRNESRMFRHTIRTRIHQPVF